MGPGCFFVKKIPGQTGGPTRSPGGLTGIHTRAHAAVSYILIRKTSGVVHHGNERCSSGPVVHLLSDLKARFFKISKKKNANKNRFFVLFLGESTRVLVFTLLPKVMLFNPMNHLFLSS